jgi:hypothetical protein
MSETFSEVYDPDIRTAWGILLGSIFVLALFLMDPNFPNPYFLMGVFVTILVIEFSGAVLISETWE